MTRLASLDQFRGYTVFGMWFVNFLRGHEAMHPVFFHHNTYLSYADTIMPQFFFAVGFAYRLTFLARADKHGNRGAYRHAIVRNLKLLALGIFVYGITSGALGSWWFWMAIFQTLTSIAVTSFWIMPVVGRGAAARLGLLAASALAHAALSHWFWYGFVTSNGGIDGGPLGFLSWSIPMLLGTLAYDMVKTLPRPKALASMAGVAAVFMLGGYALACITAWQQGGWFASPPFVPPVHDVDMWTMNQKAGSISYLIFAGGFSLAVYAACVILCDVLGLTWRPFQTLGQNALAGYLAHYPILAIIGLAVPRDSSLLWLLSGIGAYLLVTYAIMRGLERKGWYLKL